MSTYNLDILSLSSEPISQLSNADQLSANDIWIVERTTQLVDKYLEDETTDNKAIYAENVEAASTDSLIYKEAMAVEEGIAHVSRKIEYGQLSAQLLNDISARFGFNTMAYRESWQHARANHSHDYNMVQCIPHVSYDDVVKKHAPNACLMTYNIARGGYSKVQDAHATNLQKTMSIIRRGSPTIICLQEVDRNCPNTGNVDFLAKFKEWLGTGWNYIFTSFTTPSGGGQHGIGMMYKESKISNASIDLGSSSNGYNIYMQVVEFADYVVANVHLDVEASYRQTQISKIKDYFDAHAFSGKAIFIAGDFNFDVNDGLPDGLSNFTIASQIDGTTTIDDHAYDFILVDSNHYSSMHNPSSIAIDDLDASDHKPVQTSFFYNSDYTKLDEWLASMKIWALSSWEEIKQGKYGKYKVLHEDYVPTQYDIYYPYIKFPEYQKCEVGELRHIARWKMPNDMTTQYGVPFVEETGLLYDSWNDGYWAYPRGQTITCNSFEFKDICKMYGDNDKNGLDTSFTLPCLSNYMKLNPKCETSNPLSCVQYQVGLPQHQHSFATAFSDDKYKQFPFTTFIPAQLGPGYQQGSEHLPHHNGNALYGQTKFLDKQESFNTSYTTGTICMQENTSTCTGQTGVEVEPNRIDIPIIMFIGAK